MPVNLTKPPAPTAPPARPEWLTRRIAERTAALAYAPGATLAAASKVAALFADDLAEWTV